MITDPTVRDEIAKKWSVLTSMAKRTGFMLPGAYIGLGDEGCHLGLVLAFCSLDDVLVQFRTQRDIPRPDGKFIGNRIGVPRAQQQDQVGQPRPRG